MIYYLLFSSGESSGLILGWGLRSHERCGQNGDTIILYVNTWWEGKKKKTMKDSKSVALFLLMIHLCSFFIMTISFVISHIDFMSGGEILRSISLRITWKCWCCAECCHRSYGKVEKKKKKMKLTCPSVTK